MSERKQALIVAALGVVYAALGVAAVLLFKIYH